MIFDNVAAGGPNGDSQPSIFLAIMCCYSIDNELFPPKTPRVLAHIVIDSMFPCENRKGNLQLRVFWNSSHLKNYPLTAKYFVDDLQNRSWPCIAFLASSLFISDEKYWLPCDTSWIALSISQILAVFRINPDTPFWIIENR